MTDVHIGESSAAGEV